jgi:glycosyltransferase involved in cell wall biosynthesis
MIRLAIVNSNFVSINRHTKKGTEIYVYILIQQLKRLSRRFNLKITAFASGDSELPVKVESINYQSSLSDRTVGIEHHKTFEMALVSKAFSMQKDFDIYHINIGNGDTVLPLAPFVTKPILITMHGSFLEDKYTKKYLLLFNNLPNLYFVSLSSAQRLPLPGINYVATIPHGIDIKRTWKFDKAGGDTMIWAGRAIKEKGINDLPKIVQKVRQPLAVFPLIKAETPKWFKEIVEGKRRQIPHLLIKESISRHKLAHEFQKSKILLFPIHWEEPFGLVLIEALASGTPIIAYARGSTPEIIVDGVTGFIINPSPEESKGDFIIKKTGIDGFCEAIERIYGMSDSEYRAMRLQCRLHVEKYFTVKQMTERYIETYKNVIKDWKSKSSTRK